MNPTRSLLFATAFGALAVASLAAPQSTSPKKAPATKAHPKASPSPKTTRPKTAATPRATPRPAATPTVAVPPKTLPPVMPKPEPRDPEFSLEFAMVRGPKDAPITVMEYADFMCPGCQQVSGALKSYSKDVADIKIHFRNFPLEQTCNPNVYRTIHNGACTLALGGFCAAEQGLFWQYHDRVFSRSWEVATEKDALDIAEAVGIDRSKFQNCLYSSSAKSKLALDIKEGFEARVQVTPTLFVNGKKLLTTSEFGPAVDEERKKLAGASPKQ